MTLTTTLDARFGQGGFDLDASISGLSDVLGAVGLPTLSFAGDIDAFDLDGIGLDGTAEALASVLERLGGVTGALPDLDALLAPLRSALAVIDVVGSGEIPALLASFGTMPGPSGPGLPALFDAASRIGDTPGVQSVLDIVGPLGLDLRSPGALVGGPAGGLISLVQVIGALVGVDTTSREIEERSSLAIDLLSADRIASLIAAVGGDQSLRLAALLTGIDPNDANLVDIVARPVELHLANVSELLDRLVRGLAFAEATLVDADFPALVAGLTLASVALSSSASGSRPLARRHTAGRCSPVALRRGTTTRRRHRVGCDRDVGVTDGSGDRRHPTRSAAPARRPDPGAGVGAGQGGARRTR